MIVEPRRDRPGTVEQTSEAGAARRLEMLDSRLTALRTRLPAARPVARRFPRLPLRAALAGLVVALVLVGGWTLLRHSTFTAVRDVSITGLTTSEGPHVRDALKAAARGMSTLAVREDALRAAVAPYASVARLDVDPDFPHGLRIRVTERRPVAVLGVGGDGVPIAADGRLLPGVEPSAELPVVAARQVTGGRVSDRRARAAVAVLAAAPAELRAHVVRATNDSRGLVLELRDGPDLVFGTRARPQAKWAAAVRVLAEPSAAGAVYLDLRVPERVAAGGVGPIDPAATDALDGTAVG